MGALGIQVTSTVKCQYLRSLPTLPTNGTKLVLAARGQEKRHPAHEIAELTH